MMRSLLGLTVIVVLAASARGQTAVFDGLGRVRTFDLAGRWVDITTDARVFAPGWAKSCSLDDRAKSVEKPSSSPPADWKNRLAIDSDQTFLFTQHADQSDGKLHLHASITAETDKPAEAMYLVVMLPAASFAGGHCQLGGATAKRADGTIAPSAALLPLSQAADPHLLIATAGGFTAAAGNSDTVLSGTFDRPCEVLVQDERKWGENRFALMLKLGDKPLHKGEAAAIDLTLALTGTVDQSPVKLMADSTPTADAFDGFGGNYCFDSNAPVCKFTLDHLHVNWARVEMRVDQWAVEGDRWTDGQPAEIDSWAKRDAPGSEVRHELEMAGELSRRHIPTVMSVWRLPGWMFDAHADKSEFFTRGRVDDRQWAALTASIEEYLMYARAKYGVEPALFSFNESDYGVDVKLSPEDQREMITRLGTAFKRAGLKTKLLLGDVSNPRDTERFIEPALNDPQAMRFVGAVAFHSWGGASTKQYADWSAAATRAKLPLLVTETGFDSNWQTINSWLHTHYYAMQELQLDMDILRNARPCGLLQWEFTSDYAIAWPSKTNSRKFETDERFALLKQFSNLALPGSRYLPVSSDRSDVMSVAFTKGLGVHQELVLHVANLGPMRTAHLAGLPVSIAKLHVTYTGETSRAQSAGFVNIEHGEGDISLPAQSLVTLTTFPASE